MTGKQRDNPGVIAPPPLIYGTTLAAGLFLQAAIPTRFLPGVPAKLLGWSLIGLASLLAAWSFRTMWRADTNVDPYKPVIALVVNGPYRLTRNPMYLSLTLLYLGISVLVNTPWPVLLLPAALVVIRRWVIDREEQYLEKKFGGAYLRYKASVRRWI